MLLEYPLEWSCISTQLMCVLIIVSLKDALCLLRTINGVGMDYVGHHKSYKKNPLNIYIYK